MTTSHMQRKENHISICLKDDILSSDSAEWPPVLSGIVYQFVPKKGYFIPNAVSFFILF